MDAEQAFADFAGVNRDTYDAEKREIFLSVWDEAVPRLRSTYGPTGRAKDDIGFGYLIEEFARRSERLPRNTPAAEHMARLLLGILHTGDKSFLGSGRRLYNPDILFIEMHGRLAHIHGFAEVKASSRALAHQPEQLSSQESSIRWLAQEIQEGKLHGTAHEFFTKRKITVGDSLKKTLVIPGDTRKHFKDVPEGWQVQEIEFSLVELHAIAKQIWPNMDTHSRERHEFRGGSPLEKFRYEFLSQLIRWVGPHLNAVFFDSGVQPFPVIELTLFACAAGYLPYSDEDIKWVRDLMRIPEVLAALAKPANCLSRHDLNEWEEKFFLKFNKEFRGGDKAISGALTFLARNRELTVLLTELAERLQEWPRILNMGSLDELLVL